MNSDAGSYKFEADPNVAEELDRLRQQAATAAPLERKVLVDSGLSQGMRALDMACGPGLVSIEMARLVGESGSVLGIDISDSLLAVAERYAHTENVKNVSFQHGNVYELGLEDNSFDFIYARMFVQHLERPEKAFSELFRILKPGGTLCIMDIDDAWLSIHPEPAVFSRYIERAVAGQRQNGGDRHVGRKLGGYLQKAGLTEVDVNILPITSNKIGMANFINIALAFRWKLTEEGQREEARSEFGEIESALSGEHGWGFLGIFIAVGRKP